jgi:hypothetical protein
LHSTPPNSAQKEEDRNITESREQDTEMGDEAEQKWTFQAELRTVSEGCIEGRCAVLLWTSPLNILTVIMMLMTTMMMMIMTAFWE